MIDIMWRLIYIQVRLFSNEQRQQSKREINITSYKAIKVKVMGACLPWRKNRKQDQLNRGYLPTPHRYNPSTSKYIQVSQNHATTQGAWVNDGAQSTQQQERVWEESCPPTMWMCEVLEPWALSWGRGALTTLSHYSTLVFRSPDSNVNIECNNWWHGLHSPTVSVVFRSVPAIQG